MWLLHTVRPGSIVTLNGRGQWHVLLSHPEPEPWVLLTQPSPPLVSTPTYFQMGGEGKRGREPPQFTVRLCNSEESQTLFWDTREDLSLTCEAKASRHVRKVRVKLTRPNDRAGHGWAFVLNAVPVHAAGAWLPVS